LGRKSRLADLLETHHHLLAIDLEPDNTEGSSGDASKGVRDFLRYALANSSIPRGDEMQLKPPVLDEFSVTDKYDNVLVRGKVVKLDEGGLIFQADDKYYRWRCGELLGPVMEEPLKTGELKGLGIKMASAGDN